LEGFSWLQEEGLLSLYQDSGAPDVFFLHLIVGVHDHTILPAGETDGVLEADDLLLDILDVDLGILVGDQPLLASQSLGVVDVPEVGSCLQMQGLSVGNGEAIDSLHHSLVGIW
jgi:hypothetical protein